MIEPDWFDAWFNERFPPGQTEYAPKEVYLEMGWPPDRVYRAIRDGSLAAFQPSRRGAYAIPRPALRRWLLESMVINQPPS